MFKSALKIIFFLEKQHAIQEIKTSTVLLVAFLGLTVNALYVVVPILFLNFNSYFSGSLVILGTEPGSMAGIMSVVLMLVPLFLQSMIMNSLMILLTSSILGFVMSLFLKKEHISFKTSFELMLLHSFLVSILLLFPLPGFFIFVYLIGGMIIRTVLLKRESGATNQPSRFTPLPQTPL